MHINKNNSIYILTVWTSPGLERQRQKKQSVAVFVLTLLFIHRIPSVLLELC